MSPSLAPLRRAARALAALGVVGVLLWHGGESLSRFPPGRPDETLPFTQDDHPFHFYYGQLTANEFFASRLAFWGYDPTFMAGYAKTLIFPTSSTLPELIAILSGRHAALAYRAFVASTVFLTPIVLAFAARTIARSWVAAMLGTGLGVVWVWSSWPSTYVAWGMGPFILAGAISVWSGSLLADWLDRPSLRSLLAGTLLAAVAVIAHPSSAVILVCMMLPAYVARLRALGWRAHAIAWCVPLLVLGAWSPWWLPAVLLRDNLGTTASGFINPEVWARIQELLTARHPTETALLLAVPVSVAGMWGIERARFWSLVLGASNLFVLAYVASAIPALWPLQPGRYTQPLYAVLIVQAAVGCPRLASKLARASNGLVVWLAAAGACGTLVPAIVLAAHAMVAYLFGELRRPLRADLPAAVLDLAASLRQNTDRSGRILFEDRAQLNRGPHDPFGGVNPSALMPLLAPGQYIGGPYLYTHLKSNFTQCGDGKFFGRPVQRLDRGTFERYANLYNIRWAVLWSRPLVQLAEAHPSYFRETAHFGYLHVFELAGEPNWAIAGSARVIARPDRLEVFDAKAGDDGVLVLSYHWIPTLRSTTAIRPINVGDDPVPFIAVDNPPDQFAIDNGFW